MHERTFVHQNTEDVSNYITYSHAVSNYITYSHIYISYLCFLYVFNVMQKIIYCIDKEYVIFISARKTYQ